MTDFSGEAEALFRRVAERRALNIEPQASADGDVMFALTSPDQSGDPVFVGLQRDDELSFTVGDFGASFFPAGSVKGLFEKAAEGWFTGQTRLAYYWRGKRLVKICMQVKLKSGNWQRIYTQYTTWILPFLTIKTTYKLHPTA